MKLGIYIVGALICAGTRLAGAAPAETNVTAQSIFIMPSGPSEGRDPFFPNSMRPYEEIVAKHRSVVDLTALQIKGFSEIAGERYVIINNHTFAAGDEGDVITPSGRIHLRCLSVGQDSVLVESGGSEHILKYSSPQ